MLNQPQRTISTERKGIYYAGMGLMAVGFLLFISNFFFMFSMFSGGHTTTFTTDSSNTSFSHVPLPPSAPPFMTSPQDIMKGMVFRAFGGMALIISGGFLMKIGRSGPAGAGLILDPEMQRENLEPWNRAAGGMMSDALDEVKVVNQVANSLGGTKEVVKVRCRNCQTLNDEAAKFCNQCGQAM